MNITLLLLEFAVLLPAIIVHEVSHGWVALLLGDPTAKDRGRLSANPLRHIDPWGTILLPAILLAVSGGSAAFGYAKPVPINPYNFKDYRKGMFLTGIAGPTSNLLMAAVAGLARADLRLHQLRDARIVYYFALVNLTLLFFNLIPIPPLDGSRVIPLFLSDSAMQTYHQVGAVRLHHPARGAVAGADASSTSIPSAPTSARRSTGYCRC